MSWLPSTEASTHNCSVSASALLNYNGDVYVMWFGFTISRHMKLIYELSKNHKMCVRGLLDIFESLSSTQILSFTRFASVNDTKV